METAKLKFRCKTENLVNAIKKHCSIENAVIETKEDIKGAVTSLLGSKKLVFVKVVLEECRIDGDNVIIGVESLSDNFPSLYNLSPLSIFNEDNEIKFLGKKFLEESKILQEMIEQQ